MAATHLFWSISFLDLPWEYFLDSHIQAMDLITRMMPPDVEFWDTLVGPLLETLHIATLGTLVTIVVAFLLLHFCCSTLFWLDRWKSDPNSTDDFLRNQQGDLFS